MKTRLLLLMALSLLPLRAISGPDDTTKHLMKDSVSMLDFGLLRAMLHKSRRDSCRESSVVAVPHEQTDITYL